MAKYFNQQIDPGRHYVVNLNSIWLVQRTGIIEHFQLGPVFDNLVHFAFVLDAAAF